jgi:hypothetical protein
MKYKIEGRTNRKIVNKYGELVAIYRQLPKHIASEIHLSSGFIHNSNREDFLQHLHSLVDKKLLAHDLVTNVFLVHPKISGGGADMNKHRYPDKLIKFLNK